MIDAIMDAVFLGMSVYAVLRFIGFLIGFFVEM